MHRRFSPNEGNVSTALEIAENIFSAIYVHGEAAASVADQIPPPRALIALDSIGKPSAPTLASPELPADDEERLTDPDHADELDRMKDRIFGLEAALLGACNSDTIADAMAACAKAFEAEWRRTPEQRELRRRPAGVSCCKARRIDCAIS
jgi:hypothetical protein